MLKVGVFGVGHLGKFHLNNWKEITGAELVGFHRAAMHLHHELQIEKV